MRSLFIIFFFFTVSSLNVFSAEQVSLYEADTFVVDQTDNSRSAAFIRALNKVALKSTGSSSALEGVPQDVLQHGVEQMILSFSYKDNPEFEELSEEAGKGGDVEPLAQNAPFILTVRFSRAQVEEHFYQAGLALWGQLRPEVSVWLVEQSNGERQLVGEDDGDAFNALGVAKQTRGVPFLLPTADLSDLSSVDLSALWGLFPSAAEQGGQRYGSDLEVVARLRSKGAGWIVDWVLPLSNERFTGTEYASTRRDAILAMLSQVAEVLSGTYAIARTLDGEGMQVFAEIRAVNSFPDYVAVIEHLSDRVSVREVFVEKVEGDLLTLRLELLGGAGTLERELKLAGKLQLDQAEFKRPASYTSEEELHDIPDSVQKGESLPAEKMHFVWLPEINS